jgi:pyruvate/2-oxoglutarate dehydrogenase complex dihydrolipoamide dehydrogenase (E3) component
MAVAFEQRRIGLIIEVDGITGIVETWERRRLISSRGKESDLEVGAVVFAVGWPGNAHNVNLIAAGVEIGVGGYVRLDDTLRTSAPHEAKISAENAVLDGDRTLRPAVVPHGVFTDPEYGSVGLTEKEARCEQDCTVAVVSHADLDRGIHRRTPRGLVQTHSPAGDPVRPWRAHRRRAGEGGRAAGGDRDASWDARRAARRPRVHLPNVHRSGGNDSTQDRA